MNKINSRETAAHIIGVWLSSGELPDRLMEPVKADRAFVMEVTYGVTRWKRALLWVVRQYAKKEPQAALIPYILVGLYQILYMDNVSEYAAVNETVQAAKTNFPPPVTGFLNGVLRRAVREKDSLKTTLASKPPSIRYSHPDVLINRWFKQFGKAKTEALCQWNNMRPNTVLRVNTLKTSVEKLLQSFEGTTVKAHPHPYAPDRFIILGRGNRIFELPGYDEGAFVVQDPSTTEAIRLLDPQPGEIILDACAAPGGKTVAIAERMNGQGRVVALDLYTTRLNRVTENVERLGLTNVQVITGDARSAEDLTRKLEGDLFDKILLDVPCSNTGVIRRRPDARWRFNIKRLVTLMKTQHAILSACSSLLKPGGTLVYSTCSLEQEENEEQIQNWIEEDPRFELLSETKLFPVDSDTDGVYAAALTRK